jgi:hypothetical protein
MDKFAPRDKQGHYLEAYQPVVCTWKKLQIYTNCPGNQSNIWDVYKRNLDAAYDWPPIDEFHFQFHLQAARTLNATGIRNSRLVDNPLMIQKRIDWI